MDISLLATAESHGEGAECNILDPVTREPTDVFIKIMGADSKEWRAQKKKQTNAVLEARSQDKAKSIDFDAMDVDALVAVTLDWRGIVSNGEDYPFTKANAKNLYQNAPNVVSQLLVFLADGANFTKG
jgi:hypothetical protein